MTSKNWKTFKLDTFEVGKDKLRIVTIMPLEDRKEFDIGLPSLTPTLVRKKSLADEIAALDVLALKSIVLPMGEKDPVSKTFRYEGYDIITLEKMVEREYQLTEPQTAQEVIGYYARRIAEAVKLPAQFAAIAPKVREFFELKAFGHPVNLDDSVSVKAMSTNAAQYVCVDIFKKALLALTIEEQQPQLLEPERCFQPANPSRGHDPFGREPRRYSTSFRVTTSLSESLPSTWMVAPTWSLLQSCHKSLASPSSTPMSR
jgi:type III restriction enzyme